MTHSDDIDSYKDEMSCALEDVYWRVKVNKKSQNLLQIQMIPQLYILLFVTTIGRHLSISKKLKQLYKQLVYKGYIAAFKIGSAICKKETKPET